MNQSQDEILYKFKNNIFIQSAYSRILDFQCRKVKAYIFVATTGRSGSLSLTTIFEAVDNSICLHEPYPKMVSDYTYENNKDIYFHDLFHSKKQIYIKRSARNYKYYIETNHQFIKNFIAPAVEVFNKKIRIIHLIRNVVDVAHSFYQIGSIPGITLRGKLYLLDPREKNNLINVPDLLFNNSNFSHDFYKCLWYWYEIETRIKKAKERYENILFYTFRTEDLNNLDIIIDMFNFFNIPFNLTKLINLVGTQKNQRLDEKLNNIRLENCMEMNEILKNELELRFGKNFWF